MPKKKKKKARNQTSVEIDVTNAKEPSGGVFVDKGDGGSPLPMATSKREPLARVSAEPIERIPVEGDRVRIEKDAP